MVRERLRVLGLLLVLPFCLVLMRLALLQLAQSSRSEAGGDSLVKVAPRRGRILDRDGEVLAGNVPVYDIQFNYLRLNPRDGLVEILADELAEIFGEFHDRERIEEKILELARPEELATQPELPEVLTLRDAPASSDAEWIFLIGSIHRRVRTRILERWRTLPRSLRSYFEFRESRTAEYFDLWFSRRDIVRLEIVLLRLSRVLAGGDPTRWQAEYDRLRIRVDEVRVRYERRVAKDVGPEPERSTPPTSLEAHEYRKWKLHADVTRFQYHRDRLDVLVRDVSLDVVTAVESYRGSFIGLSTRSRSRRIYPEREVMGSLLGHVGFLDKEREMKLRAAGFLADQYFREHDDLEDFESDRSSIIGLQDRVGVSGLERAYDEDLRGRYGGIAVRNDRRNNRQTVLREIPVEDGKDVRTTIDLTLQRSLHEELLLASGGTSDDYGNAASAVVMDVNTGALLACVGVPSTDPNRMRDPKYRDELEARWGGQTTGWLVDRPTSARLAPGSVFKIVLAAAALETAAEIGFSPRTTTFPCGHRFPYFNIHCNARYGHGLEQVDLVQALKYSCNNYFYSIGYLKLGPERIASWARKLGFGSRPGIDLGDGGNGGRLSPITEIEDVGICHFSIGQVHVEATCLQVARSLSPIATGGTLPRPHLVKPTGPPGTVEFANPDTLRLIRDGLWRVGHQSGGTAADTRPPLGAFRVALKTGTAEVRRSGETVNNAWLAGYAPAGAPGEAGFHPRIAFAVVVEETRGHGANVCAGIVRRLLEHFAATDPDAYLLNDPRREAGD